MKTILEDIKNLSFHRCYLLFGEETYLVKQYGDKLKAALVTEGDTMNFNSYQGKSAEVNTIIEQADTMPFFADYRLIFVEDSGFFKGSVDRLPEYMENIPESTVMVFSESQVDKRSRMYKAVSKVGYASEFKKQTPATLQKWILSMVKKEGKNITQNGLMLFIEMVGDDMNNISSELEKLFSYCMDRDAITEEEVRAICTAQQTGHIFDMVDAISAKNQKKALNLYTDLVALKEPSGRILYLIGRQFDQLLKVKELQNQGVVVRDIASRLGLPEFVVKKNQRLASAFQIQDLRRAVRACVDAEESFKSGRSTDQIALELLIMELSA